MLMDEQAINQLLSEYFQPRLRVASYSLSLPLSTSGGSWWFFSFSISASIGSNHALTNFSGSTRSSSLQKLANASQMVRASVLNCRSNSASWPTKPSLTASKRLVILLRSSSITGSSFSSSSPSSHPGGSPVLPAASQARFEPALW